MFRLGDKTYKLVRIGLVRAACPREVEHSRDNLNLGKAIRIDANTKRWGGIASVNFVPPGIIMAGAARRLKLLEGGFVHDYAFVDRAVTDIRCDDEISSNELMQKLDVALRERILGPARADSNCGTPGMVYPWIIEIYPFENYFIYNLKGQKYRQGYVLDPVKREVRLGPGGTKVEEKFVTASGKDVAVKASIEKLPLTQNGSRYSPNNTPGNDQTVAVPATHADLITMLVRNWKNVLDAVENYLAAIRNGQHKPVMRPPMFAPVNLTPAGKIGVTIASKGVDVYDFARWSAAEQSKVVTQRQSM